MKVFRDIEHLFRFAALFVLAFLAFWAIRGAVIPKTFGKYGHYRAAAITDISALPVHYAGQEACLSCHSDIGDTKKAGKHVTVHCEACHGPQSKHAEDPSAVTPVKPDTAILCIRCHAASAARPKTFPQVNAEEHSNGVPCETCHQPHSPAIGGNGGAQ